MMAMGCSAAMAMGGGGILSISGGHTIIGGCVSAAMTIDGCRWRLKLHWLDGRFSSVFADLFSSAFKSVGNIFKPLNRRNISNLLWGSRFHQGKKCGIIWKTLLCKSWWVIGSSWKTFLHKSWWGSWVIFSIKGRCCWPWNWAKWCSEIDVTDFSL